MKMRNEDMAQYIEIMRPLEEKGKLGYAIARNVRLMDNAAQDYIKIKSAALVKYGNKCATADGREYYMLPTDDQGKVKAFMDEVGELGNIEIDVDIFTVSEEGFCSGTLTSAQMERLLWMVEEGNIENSDKKD